MRNFIGPQCPCCDTGAAALEILADLIDAQWKSRDKDPSAQSDLRQWAKNIRLKSGERIGNESPPKKARNE
jgi:hypothetical protein